jgi:hypothetical protein
VNLHASLDEIERRAYRSSYSDGIIDMFVGLALLVIGAIWIWAEDYGGLAGILPAAFAPSVIPLRKRVVESRGGYVRWNSSRRRREQRSVWGAFGAGVALLLLGGAALVVAEASGSGRELLLDAGPGLLAFLLALVAIVLGMLVEQWRFFTYAAALVAGGVVAVISEANPGWPLLAAGIVVAAVGAIMLVRYLRAYPAVDER